MRRKLMLTVSLAGILGAAWIGLTVRAASPAAIQLDSTNAAPREVEGPTEKAIIRDYGTAWESLTTALENNRPEALDSAFVGFAREKFRRAIAEQKKSGLRTRYLDHGHKLQTLFYSLDGSAMELRDTAQLEVQILDGSRVLSSQPVTAHYLVMMTPAADRWQVRAMQEIPETGNR